MLALRQLSRPQAKEHSYDCYSEGIMCNPELAQCSEEAAIIRLTFQNVPLSFLCFLVLLSLPSKHAKVRATVTPPAKQCMFKRHFPGGAGLSLNCFYDTVIT